MSLYEEKVKKLRQEQIKLDLQQKKKIQGIYKQSIEELAKEIRSAGEGLQKDYKRELRQQLIIQEKQLAQQLAVEINRGVRETVEGAKDLEVEMTNDILGQANLEISDSALDLLSSVQESVIADIIGSDMYGDGKTLSDRIWNTTNKYGKDIDYIVGAGIAQKKSAKELANDLIEFTKPATKRNGQWIDDYTGVKTTDPAYNAMRLARTTINHSYQTATARNSATNPFCDGVEWQTSGHVTVCPLCQDREGRIYEVKKLPMDHPNGMCTMVPVITKSMEEIGAELNAWVNGEDNPALDKWYKGLSKEVMEIIPKNEFKPKEETSKEASKGKKVKYETTKDAFSTVKWTNIEKEYAKELDSELLRVVNKYPIDSKGITVKALKDERAFGYQRTGLSLNKKTGKIEFTSEIVYSNSLQKNKERSSRYHELNYKSRGSLLQYSDNKDKTTISHEYAHAIDAYYLMAVDKELKNNIDDAVGATVDWDIADKVNSINRVLSNSDKKLSKTIYDQMQSEMGLRPREFHNKIHEELGSYAASKPEEFLAEGFANMVSLEEDKKTDFIKRFEEIFNNKYNEVFKEG